VNINVNRELRGYTELAINITDTGIGIPEDKQQYIFESFTQASSSTTRKYGGTGLGLAITKKLIELQGGTLELSSQVGQGSVFKIIIKYANSEKSHIEDEMLTQNAFRTLKGLKVLVVEDNIINQKIVLKFLSKWEATTDIADNGKIAIDKIILNQYDIVLMDLHMPEMNGYDATRIVRGMEGDYFQKLPIIALTASAFLEDRDKIYVCGMSGYIIKPFNPTELYWKISPFLK
jgi:CheY-like chemotaxis protein